MRGKYKLFNRKHINYYQLAREKVMVMILKCSYNFLNDKRSFIYLLNDINYDQNKFLKRLKTKLN